MSVRPPPTSGWGEGPFPPLFLSQGGGAKAWPQEVRGAPSGMGAPRVPVVPWVRRAPGVRASCSPPGSIASPPAGRPPHPGDSWRGRDSGTSGPEEALPCCCYCCCCSTQHRLSRWWGGGVAWVSDRRLFFAQKPSQSRIQKKAPPTPAGRVLGRITNPVVICAPAPDIFLNPPDPSHGCLNNHWQSSASEPLPK